MKATLTSVPVRKDLTDRECVLVLGGAIGALCLMSHPTNVRNAVKFWAGNSNDWDTLLNRFWPEKPPEEPPEEPEHGPQNWVKQARKNAAKRSAKT